MLIPRSLRPHPTVGTLQSKPNRYILSVNFFGVYSFFGAIIPWIARTTIPAEACAADLLLKESTITPSVRVKAHCVY